MLQSRLTRKFALETPIILAPMAIAGGGELAAACARAGALGLVGGGYGDPAWVAREYALAMDRANGEARARVGCGFITWRLDKDATAFHALLDQQYRPAAILLSFGDPRPYSGYLADAGIPLICQIQNMGQLPMAVEAGASAIVAQGAEAGGHGMNAENGRSSMTFIPEIADWLDRNLTEAEREAVSLVAAGGIADGRGVAAALMLGADGVMMGTRLWATHQALAHDNAKQVAVAASGDDSIRSSIFDILRRKNWPEPYDFRALRNELHREWEGRVEELRLHPEDGRAAYDAGVQAADFTRAHVTVGEGAGLVHNIADAGDLIGRISEQAEALLTGWPARVT